MEFLKTNSRFDFLYGGKPLSKCDFSVEHTENGNTLTTVYSFSDGLKVTNVAKVYSDFDAYEWVTWFEMTGDKPSEIISELWDCNTVIEIGDCKERKWAAYLDDKDKAIKIYSPNGSVWGDDEFFCDADILSENKYKNHIYLNDTKEYKNTGGRSADGKAPFFNIFCQNKGVIYAVGWSGQWNCKITGTDKGINIKTKIEDTNFRLLPGEKFRTSSVVIMNYECDVIESQNKWRKLVKKHYSLIGSEGREEHGPLCAGVWGGMNTEDVIERINLIKDAKLPYEYIWMDAGWYGTDEKDSPDEYEGDWWNHVGDWRVNTKKHPDELLDVRKAIKDAGLKFLLWLEPERVRINTYIAAEHPEYLIQSSVENGNLLLNLGNDEAWEYCFNTLSEIIEKLEINCYRQDFNFMPLEYWRANDDADRKGISEIKHINGLYRLWDALLERFPNLLIDNCASGGRRIDIELLKRSIPLWRSDAQCPANYNIEMTQVQNMNFNTWIPYSGAGSGRIWEDTYRIRSAYAGALTTNYFFSARNPLETAKEKVEWLKKHLYEYLKVRPYFYADFYPLTDKHRADMEWCASQYNRPEKNDGIIQVFKRENSPFSAAVFKLRGLDATKTYIFKDVDNDIEIEYSGEALMEKGIEITLKEHRVAKLYFYKQK